MQTLPKKPEVTGIAQKAVRCAIYTRVSTHEQSKGNYSSLTAQRAICERQIAMRAEQGWFALPEQYEDSGFSGKNLERPAVRRLIADTLTGKIDIIVSYKFDRMFRNLQQQLELTEKLGRLGVRFFADGNLLELTTPAGFMSNTVMGAAAQMERMITSQRTKDKMQEMRKKGIWTGGHIPLGYDRNEQKKLVVNPKEAVQLRDIFDIYLRTQSADKTLTLISQYRSKHWVSEEGREVGGKPFTKNMLLYTLRNSFYLGLLTSAEGLVKGQHEAIIDQQIFDRVQKTLAGNRQRHKSVTSNKHHFLLMGLTRCAICGSRMTHYHAYGRNGKPYRYYKCSKAQHGGPLACPLGRVPAGQLEANVLGRLEELAESPELITRALKKAQAVVNERLPKLTKELRALEAEGKKEKHDADGLMAAMMKNGLSGNALVTGKLNDLAESAKVREAKMSAVKEEIQNCLAQAPDPVALRLALANFGQAFKNLGPEDQARMIRLAVKEVVFDGQNKTITTSLRPLGTANGGSIVTPLQSVSQRWLPDLDSNQEPFD